MDVCTVPLQVLNLEHCDRRMVYHVRHVCMVDKCISFGMTG